MMALAKSRTVLRRALEKAQKEGGASIRRPIKSQDSKLFMPFILLDDLTTVGKQSGFGDHPHRGQETMTYMLEGELHHQDSQGGEGTLHAGDLQAMRAGRGIAHSEIPIVDPETNGTRGVQLWVALPEKNLNDKPGYQDVRSKDCPVSTPSEGVCIKIIAGESFGKKAPILTRAAVWYLDITMEKNTKLHHAVPENFNAFVLVLEGNPGVAGANTVPHEAVFFNKDGAGIDFENTGNRQARLLLIAGDPLEGQEVHQYGPFVSTSSGGVSKAMLDYRMQQNGFEGTQKWSSKPVS